LFISMPFLLTQQFHIHVGSPSCTKEVHSRYPNWDAWDADMNFLQRPLKLFFTERRCGQSAVHRLDIEIHRILFSPWQDVIFIMTSENCQHSLYLIQTDYHSRF
jgi:hypothetical protein